MPSCSAYGCKNRTSTKTNPENGIFLHTFPNRNRSPERFAKWVEYCNRKSFIPGRYNCLCSKHFKESDFDQTQFLKLKLMPHEILKGPSLKPGTIPSVKLTSDVDNKRSRKCKHKAKKCEKFMEEVLVASENKQCTEEKPKLCEIEIEDTSILDSEIFRHLKESPHKQ